MTILGDASPCASIKLMDCVSTGVDGIPTIEAYNKSRNNHSLLVLGYDEPVVLSELVLIEVELDNGVVYTSTAHPQDIKVGDSTGQIFLRLGMLDLADGSYKARLLLTDDTFPFYWGEFRIKSFSAPEVA